MELSISMIGMCLKDYQPEYHITEDAMSIRGVRLFADDLQEFSRDYVYIGDAWEYFHDVRYKDALLLASGQDQLLCHGADYQDFLNDVLSAFEFYNKTERDVVMKASMHESLTELVNELGKIYQGALLVFDLDGNLLASAHEEKLAGDTLYDSIKEHRRMELTTLGMIFIDENGIVSHDLTEEPRCLRQAESTGETVAMYLTAERERIGFVMMFPQEKMEIYTAFHLQKHFSPFLSMAREFTDVSSGWLPKHSILKNLLDGESLPEETRRFLEDTVKMNGDGRILLFENQGIQNYTLYRMVARELQEIGENVNCEYKNNMAILTNHRQLEHVIRILSSRLSSGKCHIGISMPVQSAEQIAAAYRQARFAIDRSADYGVSTCETYALEYLLENLKNQDLAMELLHPALGILAHYDNENQANLAETLRVYLENGCSQIKTSQQLQVHLNTLKYRLKKISEIADVDFSDERDLFYLRLSFEMVE